MPKLINTEVLRVRLTKEDKRKLTVLIANESILLKVITFIENMSVGGEEK